MAKTWVECFQEAKIIAGAGRQPCKSWVTGLWPDFDTKSLAVFCCWQLGDVASRGVM